MFFSHQKREAMERSFLVCFLKKEGDVREAACFPRGEEV